jgi:RHS repeat-associated protein
LRLCLAGEPPRGLCAGRGRGGRIVVEDYVQPQVRLDYWGQTAYAGFDRFGRVKKQLWRYHGGTPADRDRFEYTYDRNSNRPSKDLTLTAGKDEKYTYDNLNRLTSYDRGTLSGGDITSPVRNEAWTLSATGNWTEYKINTNPNEDSDYTDATDLDQDRTHNPVNEIWNATPGNAITEAEGQTAWADPAHDARGNMVAVPKPSDLTAVYACKYDAWNRLTFIWVDSDADGTADAGETVIARYECDGLGRRTKKHLNADTDDDFDTFQHFFYNSGWQLLETRKSTSENTGPETLYPEYQYVWSVRYIDALVLRDENKDSDDDCTESGTDERLYYLTDANMNVTALVNTSGTIAERYAYDPYGNVTVYSDDWSTVVTTWAASKKNNIRYCGYFFDDESGLFHVRHRYYHPTLGRWTSRDPVAYVGGNNLYEYVMSSPATNADPTGEAAYSQSLSQAMQGFKPDPNYKPAQGTVSTAKGTTPDYSTQSFEDWSTALPDSRRDRDFSEWEGMYGNRSYNLGTGAPIRGGKVRQVSDCTVLIIVSHESTAIERGLLAADPERLSAFGHFSCMADVLNRYQGDPRPGAIAGFPRINRKIGVGEGNAWNVQRDFRDAMSAGDKQAKEFASDCKCICSSIKFRVRFEGDQRPFGGTGSSYRIVNEGYRLKQSTNSQYIPFSDTPPTGHGDEGGSWTAEYKCKKNPKP